MTDKTFPRLGTAWLVLVFMLLVVVGIVAMLTIGAHVNDYGD